MSQKRFYICMLVSFLFFMIHTHFLNKESFEICYFNKKYHFKSIESNMLIDKSNYFFEYPLFTMRKLVKKHNITSKNFLQQLNKHLVKKHEPMYLIVKRHGTEYVIYRESKAFGFHITTNFKKATIQNGEVNDLIKIVGIINEYDISYLKPQLIQV
jgi:hypothetical protein